ncbi:MAG: hypothetical protein LBT81_05195 [Helicobacteraceae bacterium]|jgi:hypothetical protein|nr:hypothetical protein [Helicobacteraceae bacterium]
MRFLLPIVLIFAFFGCDQNEREGVAMRQSSPPSYSTEQPSNGSAEESGGNDTGSVLKPVITSASGSTPPRYGIEPDEHADFSD